MAHINICDYIALGLDTNAHDATSYVIAKDPDFNEIIDQSIHDTANLYKWTSPLPKRLEDGGKGFYSDLTQLYAKIKLHFGKSESPWWVLDLENQCIQQVILTEKDKDPLFSDSQWLEWEGANANVSDHIPKEGEWWKEGDRIPGVLYPNSVEYQDGKETDKNSRYYPDIDHTDWSEFYNDRGNEEDFIPPEDILTVLSDRAAMPAYYDGNNPDNEGLVIASDKSYADDISNTRTTTVLNAILGN